MSNKAPSSFAMSAYAGEGVALNSNSSSEDREEFYTPALAYLIAFYLLSNGEEQRMWGGTNKKKIRAWHLSSKFLEFAYDKYSRTVLKSRQDRMKAFIEHPEEHKDGEALYKLIEPKENGSERTIIYRMYHLKAKEDEDTSDI